MGRNKQKGAAHILALIILVLGLFVGLYLIQHPTFFKPRAAEPSSQAVSAPIDRTLPVVSITKITGAVMTNPPTNPPSGFIKGDRAEVLATATDNVGVKKVDFYVDNLLKGTSTTSPYYINWDTKALLDGTIHAIYATATDTSNNQKTSTSTIITVDRTPPVLTTLTISPPLNNATVTFGSTQTISAGATDKTSGVDKVVFTVNNSSNNTTATVCTVTTAPYNCNWVVPSQQGFYTIVATATDKVGNSATGSIRVYAQKSKTLR